MDNFIYYLGVSFLFFISLKFSLYLYDCLKWAYVDTRKAWGHRKKDAKTSKLIRTLIIIFYHEFTDGLVRGVTGVKRIS